MSLPEDLKYCAVAFIDLLGFSSHLEVSSDLRTSIGKEAVKRLRSLDDALALMEQESKKHPDSYPPDFFYTRINDALILSLDLNDVFLPDIGATYRQAMSVDEWEKHFEFSQISEENFSAEFSAKLKQYTRPVEQFVGLVARIHHHILLSEMEHHFPGVKTVISSGFRRRFISNSKEDVLSANFAFSNAYLAEQKLSGPGFFVDNNILRLLTADDHTRNISKLSCLSYRPSLFSPFNEEEGAFDSGGKYEETEVQSLTILRKEYHFRSLNSSPLTYLQLLDKISSVLGRKEIIERVMYRRIVDELSDLDVEKKVRSGGTVLVLRWPFALTIDIDEFLKGY